MLLALGAVLLALLSPWLLAPIGAIALVTGVTVLYEGRRLARLAGDRRGESICSFARSFDYRVVDTWVIRAVYEELRPYCGPMPLRATDSFDRDLRIDPDDLEDLAGDIAYRTGRSLEGCTGNPLYGKIATASDLVHFFVAQPRRSRT